MGRNPVLNLLRRPECNSPSLCACARPFWIKVSQPEQKQLDQEHGRLTTVEGQCKVVTGLQVQSSLLLMVEIRRISNQSYTSWSVSVWLLILAARGLRVIGSKQY